MSPSKVTVVGLVPDEECFSGEEDAHAQLDDNPQEIFTVSHHTASEFVSKQDFDVLSNQLEKFARFEALLSRSNIFSTPKVPVSVTDPPVSNRPFINPSGSVATGSVRV